MPAGNQYRTPGLPRQIIGDGLIVFGLVFTAFLCAVMLHRIRTVVLKADYQEMFMYEIVVCVILLIFFLDVRFGFFTHFRPLVLRIAGWTLRILVTAFSVVILFFAGKILSGCLIQDAGEAEHVIVLGMALEDGKPTKDLIFRLDTARSYLSAHPRVKLILTGGNPDASGRTEAAVMRELLLERGVSEESMVLEDQAETTKENFSNTVSLLSPDKPVVLVSSNYHMDRAVQTARSAGFTNIMRLPAPSDGLAFAANLMSEVVLEINELTLKK